MKFIRNKVKSECIHSVALVLAAVAVCVLLSFPVSALVKTASTSPRSGGETSTYVSTEDIFYPSQFDSYEEAQKRFGMNCQLLNFPIRYNGIDYQYYVLYSDGSRVYFSVYS